MEQHEDMYTVWQESLVGGGLANQLFSSIWQKKVLQINRSSNRLLIVITNLDSFSLANHGLFAKFSPRQTFPLHGNLFWCSLATVSPAAIGLNYHLACFALMWQFGSNMALSMHNTQRKTHRKEWKICGLQSSLYLPEAT